jgi:hypothetical protein
MRQQVRCIAHRYKTPNNKAHHQIQLSTFTPPPPKSNPKKNPKKPNKDKQDATTPHTKTSSENLSINQDSRNPKKRKPGRSTTQNKNTKPDRQKDLSTDRPTDL